MSFPQETSGRSRPPGTRWAHAAMALAVACVASLVAVIGVGTGTPSSASTTNRCTTAPTAVAAPSSNPFGPNVTIFDPSMSVSQINAALNAAPPSGDQRR